MSRCRNMDRQSPLPSATRRTGRAGRPRSRRVVAGLTVVGVLAIVTACQVDTPLPGATSCPVTPANSYWHANVSGLPVSSHSAAYISTSGKTSKLHADFGSGNFDGGPIGIPYTTVPGTQPKVKVTFDISDESDKGPYPIPANAPIEGGANSTGDRHVLVVDQDACKLYEMWDATPQSGGAWTAGSGAVFDLNSNAMRPSGWTSADAAGLPILPGLVRYEEVAAGYVGHAIRITLPTTQKSFVWPARHQAGSTTSASAPPMGTWLRLKSSIDPNTFDPAVRPIIVALQHFGAVVADNGSAFYISGVPDSRWDNDKLHTLGSITGSDFEVVDTSSLVVDPNSGQASTTG
jgi:hypothetical protein